MLQIDRFWSDDEDGEEAPAGVSAGEVEAWERANKVRLPEPLRSAMLVRDGGLVRETSVVVSPLAEIAAVDDDFWEWAGIDEDEAPDRSLVFAFGSHDEYGATYVMNFNARGPEGSPSVYLDHHGESVDLQHEAIADLFAPEPEPAPGTPPGVDWSEAEACREILLRETIDESDIVEGEPATREEVLTRRGDALVLFTRERSPGGEVLTRMTLPLPMAVDLATITPSPLGGFSLHLQPEEGDGIGLVRSETTRAGRRRESTLRGGPAFATVESPDRGVLEAARAAILGAAGTARIVAEEAKRAERTALLATLTPAQRSLALMESAFGTMADRGPDDFAGMPPEIAEAAAAMRARVAAMADQIRLRAAAEPIDPEVARKLRELRGPFGL